MRRLGAKISQFNRFLKDQSGNMAVVVALSALPLMMAGGAAVDYGNWISVQARLQAATDAAALAAGREANLGEEELRRVATDYFMSNFGTPRNSGTPNMTMTLDGAGKVRIDANVTVDNYLLKTIGKQSQYITASAEVSKEATGLEVVLVFDNTGSMASQSRLSTLKVAANDFVEILFGPRDEAGHAEGGRGAVLAVRERRPGQVQQRLWLDTGGANDTRTTTSTVQLQLSQLGCLARTCATGVLARLRGIASRGTSVNDTTPNPNIPDTLFPPAFAPDEPPGSSTCYRDSTVNGNRYYNSYISDMESRRRRNNVVWRQENSRKYRNVNVWTTSRGPDKGCNIQPIQALTNQKAPVLKTIRNMKRGRLHPRGRRCRLGPARAVAGRAVHRGRILRQPGHHQGDGAADRR
jgi:Flp pilus assembly protein TadG